MPKIMTRDKSLGSSVTHDGATSRELARAPVREGVVTLQYPMLTERTYGVWTVKMKIIMRITP